MQGKWGCSYEGTGGTATEVQTDRRNPERIGGRILIPIENDGINIDPDIRKEQRIYSPRVGRRAEAQSDVMVEQKWRRSAPRDTNNTAQKAKFM